MTEEPQAPTQPPDPWRSFRGIMSATLILEAIVVLLALPLVSTVGGGLSEDVLDFTRVESVAGD